eukprot:6192287-Pyramimonas_sp.AAC.1
MRGEGIHLQGGPSSSSARETLRVKPVPLCVSVHGAAARLFVRPRPQRCRAGPSRLQPPCDQSCDCALQASLRLSL